VRSIEDHALLLTPQNKGSGACPMPLLIGREVKQAIDNSVNFALRRLDLGWPLAEMRRF
jgi:hypothetical protein